MVKPRRKELMLAGLLLLLAAVAWWTLRGSPGDAVPQAAAPAGSARVALRAGGAPAALPSIDLDRLQRPRATVDAGGRNIFDFAPPPTEPPPPAPPPAPPPSVTEAEAAAAAASAAQAAARAAGPPPVAPLNVKFIGAMEGKQGLKVAILLTDRKEILTGQAGETVANRLKIVAIGHESVDVQDVGSDRVRRIPLKGN